MNAPKVDKQFAKETFKGLPQGVKTAIVIGVIGLVVYVAYRILKAPKDLKKGQGNRQEDRSWNKEFDQLNTSPSTKATITKAQMGAYANTIHAAMDGYGTGEDEILGVFKKLKNNADFAGVSAAYGVREVSSGTYNPARNFNGTMAGALTDELSQYWKDEINDVLKKNKITYRV
jgi:hypothetical protein